MSVLLFVIVAVTFGSTNGVELNTTIERGSREAPVSEPTENCVCVLLQYCNVKNFTLHKYGENVIDIRINGPCDHYLKTCCRNVTATNPSSTSPPYPVTPSPSYPVTPSPSYPNPTSPQPYPPYDHGTPSPNPPPVTNPSTHPGHHTPRPTTADRYQSRGCGFRNVDGVGFRIVGGKNEAQFGEFPWVIALLGENEKYICGGSLIHPRVVVTSTHCVRNKNIEKLVARAGEWDRGTTNEILPHQDRFIDEVIEHEDYHSGGLLNDISLLILKEPFRLIDNVDIICLPKQDYNFDYTQCVASGWGKKDFNATQNNQVILKMVSLPVVPRDECQEILRTTRVGPYFELHESFICAGGIKGQDTCNGDGGSPLMCPLKDDRERYEQAGIVAWGIGCGDVIPGIYTSVSRFRDWIDKHLGERGITIPNTLTNHISNTIPTPSEPNSSNSHAGSSEESNLHQSPSPSHDIIIPQAGCGVRRERGTVQRILDVTGDTFFAELPWMVAILEAKHTPYTFKCGGSLIHPRVILTAAHCVKEVNASSLILRAGEWDSQRFDEPIKHQDRWASTVVSHPNFNARNLRYDVAVISTETPFKVDLNVDMICLPPKGFRFDSAKCIVSGWGKDKYGSLDGRYRSILRKVEVPVVPNDHCEQQLKKTRLGTYFLLHESFVCAGGESDRDACQGDGGGPLICPLPQDPSRWAQIGVVSWGLGCGNSTNPGIYTNVPLLLPWIINQVNDLVPSESTEK